MISGQYEWYSDVRVQPDYCARFASLFCMSIDASVNFRAGVLSRSHDRPAQPGTTRNGFLRDQVGQRLREPVVS